MKTIKLLDNIDNLDTSLYDKEDKFIIFDIDDTLYKENHELVSHRRMAGHKHLNRDLNISFDEYSKLSSEYTKKYGTNYKGFLDNYKVNDDLIKGMDDICGDVKPFFTDTSGSVKLLSDISKLEGNDKNRVRCFCFSNSNKKQSEYILDVLGLSKYLDTLFCVSYKPGVETICKPMAEAFDIVNRVLNKDGKKKILFFDDNARNIEAAGEAGWIPIKVNNADDIEKIVKNEMEKHFNF